MLGFVVCCKLVSRYAFVNCCANVCCYAFVSSRRLSVLFSVSVLFAFDFSFRRLCFLFCFGFPTSKNFTFSSSGMSR